MASGEFVFYKESTSGASIDDDDKPEELSSILFLFLLSPYNAYYIILHN